MKVKKVLSLALVLVMVFALGACGGGSAAADASSAAVEGTVSAATEGTASGATGGSGATETVKIGVLLPFSGSSSYFAENAFKGMEFAREAFFTNNPDAFFDVEFIKGDHTAKADVGVTEFERMVNEHNVNAVIGTYNSGVAAAIAPLATKYQIPFMVNNAVADSTLSEPNSYVYRCNVGDYDCTADWINFFEYLNAMRDTPVTKLAVVYENTDFGQGTYDNIATNVCPELGIEIVLGEAFANNSTDLSSVVNKVKASGADFVIPMMFLNDALLFTRQMKEFECNVPVIAYGSGYDADDFLPQSGDAAEYFLLFSTWLYDENTVNDEAKAWVERYREETGYYRPHDSFANGWMAMYTLLQSIQDAGNGEREAIAQSLAATDIKPGHPALIFHNAYDGIKFGDDGLRYNQNLLCSTTFGQAQENTYRVIFPENTFNSIIYPIPAWDER